jgi:hypothetical protein
LGISVERAKRFSEEINLGGIIIQLWMKFSHYARDIRGTDKVGDRLGENRRPAAKRLRFVSNDAHAPQRRQRTSAEIGCRRPKDEPAKTLVRHGIDWEGESHFSSAFRTPVVNGL